MRGDRQRRSPADGRFSGVNLLRWRALLEVVKGMEATWQNPVLRYDLRAKARKHIGDTGLLDHLLRHMAGQVFPDGKERLVRRHNSEGAIQYWLDRTG